MSRDDIIQNVKDAKFQFEFMALMLLSGRNEKVAEAYEKWDHQAGTNRDIACEITGMAQIVTEDSDV